ncbi:sodium/proton antiporter, NhaA family [Ferrimonas sediminum]|uniref:Na(+)/H(+) antiporter NhaA n=1 Tax=Ferrimonas sediminum TaxID=718193 RepID=A0A1G8RKN4_9GAMM|nr:Na+/H+ antiporter NhaA [Ferrimonas sediminum]SDJ17557.1 sodium/proton antiporter, NhaA family [Ferrimonas sediminum]
MKAGGNKSSWVKRGQPSQLPKEHIDWVIHPVTRFVKLEASAGLVLLLSTLLALALANSAWREPFATVWHTSVGINIGAFVFERSLHSWVNDAAMTLFFFLIALELKRELVLGELRQPRLAMLSISAALGGMLFPALVYLLLQFGEPGQHGWGTVMATDTAFVIGCLALLGRRIPKSLRIFMLSLAVVDDIGAIMVVAIGYGSEIDWFPIGLAMLGLVLIRLIGFLGVRSMPLFFLIGGLVWLAVDASGIHPTVTGVVLGLMTPTSKWVTDDRLHTIMDCVVAYPPGDHWSGDTPGRRVLKTAEAAAREALSPVERLEMLLHPWVGFVVMPLFALANAGVQLSDTQFSSSLMMAVFLGLVFGKPVGILLFSWLAVTLRIAVLPRDLSWRLILGGGALAGIGFTMALFIAELAYSPAQIHSVKLAILLASVASALFGLVLLLYLTPPAVELTAPPTGTPQRPLDRRSSEANDDEI